VSVVVERSIRGRFVASSGSPPAQHGNWHGADDAISETSWQFGITNVLAERLRGGKQVGAVDEESYLLPLIGHGECSL